MDVASLVTLTLEQLETNLAEALQAQHGLMIGQREVSVRDADGKSIQYTDATARNLSAYIAALQSAIAAKKAGTTPRRHPIYLRVD